MNGWHKGMILCIVALSACTSEMDHDLEVQWPIGFTATADRDARGTPPTITAMGVYAYHTGSSSWEDYTLPTPNFMSNQKIENLGNGWTYSPIKYWPNATNDKISFFAYAPYTETPTSSESTTFPSEPTITFEEGKSSFVCKLPATIPTTTAPELFVASLINQSKSTTALTFAFKYALTKVSFKIENSTILPVTVSSLTLTAPAVGHFAFGGTNNNGYTCTTESTPLSTATFTLSNIQIGAGVTSTEVLGTFYLLPDKTNVSCTLTLGLGDRTFSFNGDATNWESGKSIVYKLILQ